MLNKTLLLFTLFFLSGCVERGFDLTVNKTTHTVTAIKTVDTRGNKNNHTETDIKKMKTAVEKEQKKSIISTKTPETSKVTTEVNAKKSVSNKEQAAEKEKQLALAEKEKIEKEKAEKLAQEKDAQQKRDTLLKKQAAEKEKQLALAKKQRQQLAEKAKAEKLAQEKEAEKIKAIQIEKEKKAREQKLAREKQERLRKAKAEKVALERKIAQEQKRQAEKEKAEKAALEKKLSDQKIAEEKKSTLARKAKEDAAKKDALEKERQDKITKEKAAQARKIAEENEKSHSTTESLVFQQSRQTYQKFGTSEIHGHVVYITPSGQDIRLRETKIYLVPKNTKIAYWYENYYLKNKEASSLAKTTVNYVNATHLNLEKNFSFYGLAKGTYYVIIESSYPPSIAKNKKVYIAKKIDVEKYKKIMTVFSKKL